jgi:hypothetical protein
MTERQPIADWERQSMEFLAKKLHERGDELSEDSASWLEKFALESALPRGLPAGSDAIDLCYCEVHKLVLHPNQYYIFTPDETCESCMRLVREHDEGMAQVGYPPTTTFKPHAQRAPAEQPSCGQDARDAARYRALRNGLLDGIEVVYGVGTADSGMSGVVSTYMGDLAGDALDKAIDAAIAAQQRQGGAP